MSSRQPTSFRPEIDVLEDRCLLSTGLNPGLHLGQHKPHHGHQGHHGHHGVASHMKVNHGLHLGQHKHHQNNGLHLGQHK